MPDPAPIDLAEARRRLRAARPPEARPADGGLWDDEVPAWLRDPKLPGSLLFRRVGELADYAREHGHAVPTLLELTAARRIRSERHVARRRELGAAR